MAVYVIILTLHIYPYMTVCSSVCKPACSSVWLSVHQSVRLPVLLFVSLSVPYVRLYMNLYEVHSDHGITTVYVDIGSPLTNRIVGCICSLFCIASNSIILTIQHSVW